MHARFRRSIAVWTFVSVASAGFASAQRAPAGALPPQAASLRLTDEMLSGAGASALSWDWAFDGPVAPAPAGPLLFDDALTRSAPAPADDLTRIRAAAPTTLTIARDPFQWDGVVNGGSTPGYQVRIDSPALAFPLSYDTRPAAWPDAFAAPTPWLQSRLSVNTAPPSGGMIPAYRGLGSNVTVAWPPPFPGASILGNPGMPVGSIVDRTLNDPPTLTSSHAALASGPRAASATAATLTISPLDVSHPAGVPSLSSNPGAPYTVYLDFAGFSFSGTWGGDTGLTPGDTPAFMGETTSFTTAEQASIRQIWARVAEKYSPFSVNVTTVDPFVAAGMTGTDADRQAFYDQQAQLMHTVIGGNGSWAGGGGISFVGVTKQVTYQSSLNGGAGGGFHTNWIFPLNLGPNNNTDIGEASAHENGHGFGLQHQGDWTNGNSTEYSTNNNAQGPGSFAPIMGASYSAQRGLWRLGNAYDGSNIFTQNDPQVIAGNPNMTIVDDGNGHTQITATPLPLNGTAVNFNAAKGVIVPASSTSPNPIGVPNYTTDFFSFASTGGTLNVTLFDGGERITPGTPDPGGTLNSTLILLDSTGHILASAPTNPSTLSENITQSLAPGLFYLQVASAGGQTSTFDSSAQYYDMGDFFLSGVVPAPEPTSLTLSALGAAFLLRRRRRLA